MILIPLKHQGNDSTEQKCQHFSENAEQDKQYNRTGECVWVDQGKPSLEGGENGYQLAHAVFNVL